MLMRAVYDNHGGFLIFENRACGDFVLLLLLFRFLVFYLKTEHVDDCLESYIFLLVIQTYDLSMIKGNL